MNELIDRVRAIIKDEQNWQYADHDRYACSDDWADERIERLSNVELIQMLDRVMRQG